jgi:hypothetical protein
MEITLNESEMHVGASVGVRRHIDSLTNKRTPRFPERHAGQFWIAHIEGAMAELAVAKYLGMYWGFGVNTFVAPDIESTDIEVRWSQRADLKIKSNDTGVVISVSGQAPTYIIKGWIMASKAKQDKYYYDKHPPCWFVPHEALRPIQQLNLLLKKRSHHR